MADVKISEMPAQVTLTGDELIPAVDLTLALALRNRQIQIEQIVPKGGTDGQVLTKTSNSNYALAWESPAGGGGSAFYVAHFAQNGTLVSSTANAAGFTTAEAEPGIFEVTHNLGTINYSVIVQGIRNDYDACFSTPQSTSYGANSVFVGFRDLAGALVNPLQFTIVIVPGD